MKSFRSTVPIKKFRSELKKERRIQTLQFKRSMTPLQVIIHIFQHITRMFNFQYLENTFYSLSVSPNQEYDGGDVIDRRGALYLCEAQLSHVLY